MLFEKKPKILLSRKARFKMMEYARLATGEITGFADVEETPTGLFIPDAYILPQSASGAHVDIEASDVRHFIQWAAETGQEEKVAKAKCWWHSHAGFNVFRSGTDRDTCDRLLGTMPYLVCIVVNKAQEYDLSLHLKHPHRMTLGHMRWQVADYDQEEVAADCKAEVAEMVKSPTYSNPYTPQVLGGGVQLKGSTSENNTFPAGPNGYTREIIKQADELVLKGRRDEAIEILEDDLKNVMESPDRLAIERKLAQVKHNYHPLGDQWVRDPVTGVWTIPDKEEEKDDDTKRFEQDPGKFSEAELKELESMGYKIDSEGHLIAGE